MPRGGRASPWLGSGTGSQMHFPWTAGAHDSPSSVCHRPGETLSHPGVGSAPPIGPVMRARGPARQREEEEVRKETTATAAEAKEAAAVVQAAGAAVTRKGGLGSSPLSSPRPSVSLQPRQPPLLPWTVAGRARPPVNPRVTRRYLLNTLKSVWSS
ncbi:hypothetical protein E2C01_024701 [Portunus trituberculatus]|uniref:Uncharacterized protein n=1 Tax=Portunus trituberculatus TaxID=210409 RepID=A0A5B7EB99_PORTR|nr:hypothetical protein [Portunus trituberculatus]